MKRIAYLVAIFMVSACSSGNNDDLYIDPSDYETNEVVQKSALEQMEVAFEGFPDAKEIEPLLESVMINHGLEYNESNRSKCGSVLVEMRKASVLGVTEMEILKHMHQKGDKSLSFSDQAATSLYLLEQTK